MEIPWIFKLNPIKIKESCQYADLKAGAGAY
jgi:hypothetical protein